MKLISVDQFRKEARSGRAEQSDTPIFRVSIGKPKALDDGSRKVRFCFSDGSVDRMGDTIDPAGWDITDFLRNPVALWAHDSSQPPVGRASDVTVEGQRLMGDIEFVDPQTYAFGDTIYRLVTGDFIRACSVGFLPTEWSFVENDPDRGWGIDFKRQQLLEISVCPIPANPNALAEARSKGIDTRPLIEWAERCLDGGGKIILSKSELERLRKAAKEPPMTRRATPRRRADDEDEDDKPKSCGRAKDDDCDWDDPSKCSVHGKRKADDDDDDDDKPAEEDKQLKRLLRALRRLLKPRAKADDDDGGDNLPMEHHDAVRMAHRALRTSKALLTEAVTHHSKAMSLLNDVVDAIDDDDDEDKDEDENQPSGGDDPDDEKAAQLRRAAELRRKHKHA